MMHAFRHLVAAVGAFAVLAGPVHAADLDTPLFSEDVPEYQPVEIGNGWYIRGDLAANFAGRQDNSFYSAGVVNYDNQFGDVGAPSVGIGYQFTDFLRADLTLEKLFASEFASQTPVAPRGPCIGWGIVADPVLGDVRQTPYNIDNCIAEDSASYESINLMANAYVDLGTYMGFTPYVGGGIGAARVSWREETDSTICIPTSEDVHEEGCSANGYVTQPAPNEIYREPGTINEGTDYRLAYSLIAGVGYKATRNLTFDMSYRYFSVGSGKAFDYGTTPGSSMAQNGFGTHQVKVGVRYALW